jgi:hypothetical protein
MTSHVRMESIGAGIKEVRQLSPRAADASRHRLKPSGSPLPFRASAKGLEDTLLAQSVRGVELRGDHLPTCPRWSTS